MPSRRALRAADFDAMPLHRAQKQEIARIILNRLGLVREMHDHLANDVHDFEVVESPFGALIIRRVLVVGYWGCRPGYPACARRGTEWPCIADLLYRGYRLYRSYRGRIDNRQLYIDYEQILPLSPIVSFN